MASGARRRQPPANQWGVILAVVAAADGVLGYLAATTADPTLQAILALGAIMLLLLCLWTVVQLRTPRYEDELDDPVPSASDRNARNDRNGPAASNELEIKHDLYITTPMGGLDEKSYEQHRQQIGDLIEELQAARIMRIACRIREVDHDSFGASDVALERNLRSIRQSKAIVLVMPSRRSTSSALVEVGAALAMGKLVFAFVSTKLDYLPFLIRASTNQPNGEAGPINLRTYAYGDFKDISRHIIDNKHLIFGQPALPPST